MCQLSSCRAYRASLLISLHQLERFALDRRFRIRQFLARQHIRGALALFRFFRRDSVRAPGNITSGHC